MRRTVTVRSAAAALLTAALLGACVTEVDGRGTPSPAAQPLRIVLVNDDGITNPAIDVLLGVLSERSWVEVTVVAPSRERSGSSDRLSPGSVAYREATTPGGAPGWAVNGYPGDAVVVALEELGLEPHLVVSGINPGQNIGPFAEESGTVGIGRTAIRRGVPALAVSAGPDLDEEQFLFAADLARDWIAEHRDALVDGSHQTDTVTSINVPDCPVDTMGELREVPRAEEFPDDADPFESSCDLSDTEPDTDYEALAVGYPAITQVPGDI